MTNQGAKTASINPGGSYTIPAGYHNGGGKVTANANQNSGTYTFPANDTGGTKDLGVNNTYRYVNAGNVYNKGKTDGRKAAQIVTVRVDWGGSKNFRIVIEKNFAAIYTSSWYTSAYNYSYTIINSNGATETHKIDVQYGSLQNMLVTYYINNSSVASSGWITSTWNRQYIGFTS